MNTKCFTFFFVCHEKTISDSCSSTHSQSEEWNFNKMRNVQVQICFHAIKFFKIFLSRFHYWNLKVHLQFFFWQRQVGTKGKRVYLIFLVYPHALCRLYDVFFDNSSRHSVFLDSNIRLWLEPVKIHSNIQFD